jgi:choline dehydrogenase-like flavoprotein
MHFSKLRSDRPVYDVCVVGAGPIGLTVALECEAAGLSVLLLEAGDESSRKPVECLNDVEILDASRHPSLDLVTRNGLGGTSAVWGGRCVPFDDIDFEQRSFVPYSSWPISHRELTPWYLKAASYLDCGGSDFVSSAIGWNERPDVSFQTVERLSSQPRLAQRFKHKLRNSRLLDLRLGHVISGLELDHDSNSVRSLKFAHSPASENPPTARAFVLACGGLQTTRIMLDLQQRWPQRFGGEAGPLGRFYMGHLTGKIATLVLHNPADIERFDYTLDERGYWFRRRFVIPSSTQIERQLLNTAFWLGNPPFHDPGHASAAASSIYLGLTLPVVGKKFSSKEFFAFHRGAAPVQIGEHLANVLRSPAGALEGVVHAFRSRMSTSDLRPFFLRNSRGKYALHYHAEQIPNPLSRVRLVSDPQYGARMSVDFRFCDDDARSIVRAHEVLDNALRQSGKGHLEYLQTPEQRLPDVLDQARDGYHQIGTTRMHESDKFGVVDRDCRVHEVNNLYLAGSAVFPTSGQANPTFLAVALAARLAGHLQKQSAGRNSISA